MVYSKVEATNFDNAIANTDNTDFKYKTKLIGKTTAANGILENGKYCVLVTGCMDNGDGNSKIIFTKHKII